MSKRKSIKTIKETTNGRNIEFLDKDTKKKMTRLEFIKKIEKGLYPGYHVRKINRLKTPVSNPDKSTNNNLD